MNPASTVSFADFQKVEITVGEILSAERVPETDKLLKLMVDFGSPFAKGVPHSDAGRVVNTPPAEDGSAPLDRGDTTPALADSGTPFIKGDTTTPPSTPLLGKEEREILPTREIRQIISGIAAYFPDAQVLVGKKCMFVTNLEPRVIKGLESNGMLLAVSTEDGKFSLLEPSGEIPEGTRAR